MIRRPYLLLALAALFAVSVLARTITPAQAADEDAPLDYAYYKARIAPILHEQCGACHANPRKRSKVGKFFLRPAPGRRLRERFHERNFKNVLTFVEPDDPSASLLLLKAIGPTNGGVTHGGGAILGTNAPAYGAIIDWINGAKRAPETFKPPASEAGQPDFLFFYKRIEPVLLGVCAECHAGRGHGRHKLITHERGEAFPLEDHYANYEMALQLLVPGRPDRSRFLAKPLALADGGIKHRGGDRIKKGSSNYANWVLFINGEKGPPIPTPGEREVPVLTAAGLTIQAEDFIFEGDVDDVEVKGAEDFYVARAGRGGGRIWTDVRVADGGPYTLSFRVLPGTAPLRWGFDERPARALPLPGKADLDEHGFGTTGPVNLLDDKTPLLDARGDLRLEKGILHMDGRRGVAAWLSPSEVRNRGCAAQVKPADEEAGGDDAFLLFDMADVENGKFAGLTDGGRQFVMGVIEGGKIHVLRATKAPPPKRKREDDPREIKVETFGGVAVGSLDGKPLLFLNLSEILGRGRFGVMTHGLAEVHHVAALEEYEVYAVAFRAGSIVSLPPGVLRLWVEIPGEGGAVDAVRLQPSGG